MTDAMQTIRDLLVEISDWTIQPYAGARPECHFCGKIDGHYDNCISLRAKSSIAVLDSLAVTPSEDAKVDVICDPGLVKIREKQIKALRADIDKYQEVSPGVWSTPVMEYAVSAYKDMISAGEHGPKAQENMIETLAEHFKAFATLITALDSLAVTPSEDARTEAKRYAKLLGEYSDKTIDAIASLIQSRDERIRRECASRGKKKLQVMVKSPNQRDIPSFKSFRDRQAEELYAAILTPEATNGQ